MYEFDGQSKYLWVIWLLTKLGLVVGNPWPDVSHIYDLIEDSEWEEATKAIQIIEQEYGPSTETTKLTVRIDRIRILGR